MGSLADTRTIQVTVPRSVREAELITTVKSLPGVAGAGLNEVVALAGIEGNQEGYERFLRRVWQFALPELSEVLREKVDAPSFPGDYWIDHIRVEEAWAISTGSAASSAKIGVVDTGIDKEQTVIDESRLQRFDALGAALSDDDTKYVPPKGHHGRWVTGFAAGYKNEEDNQVRGVAWANHVVMIDVVSPKKLHLTDLDAGISTAIEKGAQVINVSIAPEWCDSSCRCTSADGKTATHDDIVQALQHFREAQAPWSRLRGVPTGSSCMRRETTARRTTTTCCPPPTPKRTLGCGTPMRCS
jgi:subtilisin family serine protease